MSTGAGDQLYRVALAAEPPFRLGSLTVTPALRQVSFNGHSHTLEPRVMQVLVALAGAGGGIVGRDELIARCWDGRIVGENAINRVVSLLRSLASETGAFRIETVTKVGYRLRTDDTPPAAPETLAETPQRTFPRRAALIGIGVTATAAAAYLLAPGNLSTRRRDAERHYRAGINSERTGEAGATQAVAHYEAAVRVDPDYAPAWGALARALTSAGDAVPEDRAEPLTRRAGQAAARAIQLDPRNADALLARTMIGPVFRHWAEIESSARAALAVRPELNFARTRLALTLTNVGRNREASALIEQAAGNEPLLPGLQARRGWLLWQTGETHQARRVLDWAYHSWPDHLFIWVFRCMFLSLTGETAEAIRMTQREGARTAAGGPLPAAVAALCARALSRTATAGDRRTAIEAIATARQTGDIASFIAAIYLAALGETHAAFEQSYGYLLGQRDPVSGERQPLPSYAERWTDFLFSPPTAGMRADPRFPKLTAAIGLDAYWRSTGTRPDQGLT